MVASVAAVGEGVMTPKPERMWAVIHRSKRSSRIVPGTVRRTWRDAVKAWRDAWNFDHLTWSYWRENGYTVERVIVSVEVKP